MMYIGPVKPGLTCAFVPIPFVALIAGAEVAAERVSAVAEDIAGSVLALVHVGHVTAFAPVAVVTVALRVQARAVLALAPCRVETVSWKSEKSIRHGFPV